MGFNSGFKGLNIAVIRVHGHPALGREEYQCAGLLQSRPSVNDKCWSAV